MCGGSGGWSYPTPKELKTIENHPEIQLFNLKKDPSEKTNLQSEHPEIVNELRDLLIKYYKDGRSTPGEVQLNDPSHDNRREPAFISDNL